MSKLIIVPDVHGRTFWKEATKSKEDGDKIIFLGDYLDPYEDIHSADQLDNLEDIINVKKNDPENVILLLGNHDRHYMPSCKSKCSRYNWEIPILLKEYNISFEDENIFKIIHQEVINGTKFVFTHAGIHKRWLEMLNGFTEIDPEQINLFFFDELDSYYFDNVISYLRGGSYNYGSLIWADVREFLNEEPFENTVQIFGHTQLANQAVNISNNFFCLDVRRPFYIDNTGIVREMDGSEINLIDTNLWKSF